MFKLIAGGAGFGAGFQAWRNYPADGPASGDMLAVVFGACLVMAYFGGRWANRGNRATATATAHAESHATAAAQNKVQVFIGHPGMGAAPQGVQIPGDDAAWLVGSREMVSLDQLDGMDVAELLDDLDTTEARP